MNVAERFDPLVLLRGLIGCRSITPDDCGAQDLLADALTALGFAIVRLPFGPADAPTPNLFASIGEGAPHLCFVGHTDVVPPGDGWSADPFEAVERDGVLFGRGACDMKGGIAAFAAASAAFLQAGPPRGTVSLLITGDEEGSALNGTRAVVEWLREHRRLPDYCLVGEPTNHAALGDIIKIGRRGSLNATLEIHGTQGHVAYPERADNPAHRLIAIVSDLTGGTLDHGSPDFAPSSLQVTSIDIGNPATNVIPARATARLNIRFNDRHDGASLAARLRAVVDRHAPGAEIDIAIAAEPFLCSNAPETSALANAIRQVTGREPRFDTGGGTSDARFLAPFCRVAEFGLVGASMHQVDEHVRVDDLRTLAAIYERWLSSVMPTPTADS